MNFTDTHRAIKGLCHISLNHSIENTLLLVGVARSGTTWLSEIINHNNDYRYIFEPFYPKYMRPFRNLIYMQYIRPGENQPELLSSARRVLTGGIRHAWTDRFNRKIFCRKRLIKDIRINLFLKWLKDAFPALRIIFLLRHPFAVAHSRMRLGWTASLGSFLNQSDLLDDYLSPFLSVIQNCQDDFERQICLWSIQNYIPLQQFKDTDSIYICFYERFCVDGIAQTKNLLAWLKKNGGIPSEGTLRKLSRMNKFLKEGVSGEGLIRKWTDSIDESQVQRGVEILAAFGLDKIYGSNSMPKEPFILN